MACERALRSYTNRSLDAAEIIIELVELAEQLREERERGTKVGLRQDELALYDAVCQNDPAIVELGDGTLKAIAHKLVGVVRRNATIDWNKKEQVRASLRRHIRPAGEVQVSAGQAGGRCATRHPASGATCFAGRLSRNSWNLRWRSPT